MWGLIIPAAIGDLITVHDDELDPEDGAVSLVTGSLEYSNEVAYHMAVSLKSSLPEDATQMDYMLAAYHAVADVVVISDNAPTDAYEAVVAALHGNATTDEGATRAFLAVAENMGLQIEFAYENNSPIGRVCVDEQWLDVDIAGAVELRDQNGLSVADELWAESNRGEVKDEIIEPQELDPIEDIAIAGAESEEGTGEDGIGVEGIEETSDPEAIAEEVLVEAQASISMPACTYNVTDYALAHPMNDKPRTSFLHKNGSGQLERIEYINDALVVETLSSNYKAQNQKIINPSTYYPSNLASRDAFCWGGFYSGSQFNFVVTGQKNDSKNDNLVVFRVTKYSKNWDYIAAAEFKDGKSKVPSSFASAVVDYGTKRPFSAGSVVMKESNGLLYVRTTHTVYTGHQASAQLVVNPNSMTITDSMTYILNQKKTAYGEVSHSFAQRMTELRGVMYSLDQGDAHPRSVSIKKFGDTKGGVSDVLSIGGISGNNKTGVTLGGFESSESAGTLISTGATFDQSKFDSCDNMAARNVFVAISTATPALSKLSYLTNYAYNSNRGADLTKLVKIDDTRFLVLWSEMITGSEAWWGEVNQTGNLGYAFIDGNGKIIGSVQKMTGYLSECDPIVYDGKVVWYAEDWEGNSAPVYYSIDIYNSNNESTKKTDQPSSGGIEVVKTTKSLDAATVTGLTDKTYTGSAQNPAPTVKYNGTTLKSGTDYTVAYTANTNAGTATVTITGKGDYTGTKKVTFKINPAPLASVKLGTTSYTYDGKAKEPAVTVTATGVSGNVPTTGYTAKYSNNTNAGTATVTVTGAGNFTGTKTATFTITKPASTTPSTTTTTTPKTINFVDINSKTAHYEAMMWAGQYGISTGYRNSNGTYSYKPLQGVTRADMASFMFNLAKLWGKVSDSWTPTAAQKKTFKDVSTSTPYAKEIWWLASQGITEGWTLKDGTKEFRPNATIVRCDMAAFLFRMATKLSTKANSSWQPTAAQKKSFKDVTEKTSHSREVWWMASTGISAGWAVSGGKEFRPLNTIARADFTAFVYRLYNL